MRCEQTNSRFCHARTDPVKSWRIHYMTRKFFIDTAENGPFKVAPLSADRYANLHLLRGKLAHFVERAIPEPLEHGRTTRPQPSGLLDRASDATSNRDREAKQSSCKLRCNPRCDLWNSKIQSLNFAQSAKQPEMPTALHCSKQPVRWEKNKES